MLPIGIHVSISGSIDKAVDRAKELGCTTFQIFTRNPRGWKFSDLKEEDTKNFRKKLASSDLVSPLDHMPYLPNLATPEGQIYKQSVHILTAELKRSAALGIPYVVAHVGSHKGKGIAYGIKRVTDACNMALKEADNNSMILLEITAGTKNSVGSTFEHLRQIIDGIRANSRVGVCFDTCHAFAAGYDISRKEGVQRTIKLLDEIIGLERVNAVHANDSKGPLGSGLDRHEHIGLGYIGEKGFRELFSHKHFKDLPMVLETPIDGRRDDVGNIKKLKQICS
ncbi:MAG: deoxyribonuclease IV [Thaumarchaeota archaeon]|nr:deoxyribonuclease IV [Nitrososphaerota archaeon]